jgi:hypothetical protein
MPNHFFVTSSAGLNDNSFQAFGNALNYDINNTGNPSSDLLVDLVWDNQIFQNLQYYQL